MIILNCFVIIILLFKLNFMILFNILFQIYLHMIIKVLDYIKLPLDLLLLLLL